MYGCGYVPAGVECDGAFGRPREVGRREQGISLGSVAFQVFDADLIVGRYRVHDCSESYNHHVLHWASLSVLADQRVGNVRNA